MISEFISKMEKILISNSFVKPDWLYPSIGVNIPFIRNEGAVLYVVNLVDTEKINIKELPQIIKTSEAVYDAVAKKYGFRSVIIFNVIPEIISSMDTMDYVDNAEEFISQPKYSIALGVDLTNGTVHKNPKQPYKLMNIIKYAESALGTNSDEYTKELKPVRKFSFFMLVIILLNLTMLALTELNGGSDNLLTLIQFGALEKTLVLYNGEYWRLLSCMFLHAGLAHFAYNSLSLYIFGDRVEKYMGRLNFILIYLISGIAGSVASLFFANAVCVGASGGIFGLMGAVLILARFTDREVANLSYYSILLIAVIGILMGFIMPNVGNAAHIGGFTTGMILSFVVLLNAKKNNLLFYAEKDSEEL